MKSHMLRRDDHEEKTSKQHAKGELRNLEKVVQYDDESWEHLGRKEPSRYCESHDLQYNGRYAEHVERVAVLSSVEVLADSEPDDKEDDQLGDHHGREYLHAHGLLEATFVYQHFGDHAEAGKR